MAEAFMQQRYELNKANQRAGKVTSSGCVALSGSEGQEALQRSCGCQQRCSNCLLPMHSVHELL